MKNRFIVTLLSFLIITTATACEGNRTPIGTDTTGGGITLPIPGTGTEYMANFSESVEWGDNAITYKLESVGLTADGNTLLLNIYVDNKNETRDAKISPADTGSMLFYNNNKLEFSDALNPLDMITAAKHYPGNKYEISPQTTGNIIVPLKSPENIGDCKFTIYPNVTGSDDTVTFSFSAANVVNLPEPSPRTIPEDTEPIANGEDENTPTE